LTKESFFDPLRGKRVLALPEERVRRQLVDWLIGSAGVPSRLIALEFPLSKLDPLSRKRADVVVWKPLPSASEVGGGKPASRGGVVPWLLVECKAPGVALNEDVADQVRGYAAKIRAEHVLVTNGDSTLVYGLTARGYEPLGGLPRFPLAAG
jgi:hypothetical protein